MTLARMMTRSVTIQHRTLSVSVDEYGNPLPGTDSTTNLYGYFEQTAAMELTVDQETYTSDALLVLPAGTAIDGSDRVIVDGQPYEVVGPPARPWRPRTGEHHIEVRLRTTSG